MGKLFQTVRKQKTAYSQQHDLYPSHNNKDGH